MVICSSRSFGSRARHVFFIGSFTALLLMSVNILLLTLSHSLSWHWVSTVLSRLLLLKILLILQGLLLIGREAVIRRHGSVSRGHAGRRRGNLSMLIIW